MKRTFSEIDSADPQCLDEAKLVIRFILLAAFKLPIRIKLVADVDDSVERTRG